jgi:hypothetical protein
MKKRFIFLVIFGIGIGVCLGQKNNFDSNNYIIEKSLKYFDSTDITIYNNSGDKNQIKVNGKWKFKQYDDFKDHFLGHKSPIENDENLTLEIGNTSKKELGFRKKPDNKILKYRIETMKWFADFSYKATYQLVSDNPKYLIYFMTLQKTETSKTINCIYFYGIKNETIIEIMLQNYTDKSNLDYVPFILETYDLN